MNNVDKKSILKVIVKYNEKQLAKVNGDQTYAENLFTIESNGQDVYDFFLDETMRESVEPFVYYDNKELDLVIKEWRTS